MKNLMGITWVVLVLFLAGCSSTQTGKGMADTGKEKAEPGASGTLMIDETQIMLLLGGSYGKGSLMVGGQSYDFKARGLKLGGLGVHKLKLKGDVYYLNNVSDFAGTYFAAEAAITVVKGMGGFWLKNGKGVTLHLRASGEGLALGIGMEGLKISMEKNTM